VWINEQEPNDNADAERRWGVAVTKSPGNEVEATPRRSGQILSALDSSKSLIVEFNQVETTSDFHYPFRLRRFIGRYFHKLTVFVIIGQFSRAVENGKRAIPIPMEHHPHPDVMAAVFVWRDL